MLLSAATGGGKIAIWMGVKRGEMGEWDTTRKFVKQSQAQSMI